MSCRIRRSPFLALAAVLSLLALPACSGGGGSGGGSGTPTDPEPSGPDRSGTWTLRVTPTTPCAGDPTSFTITADLVQVGRSLEGSGCSPDGNPATVSLTLSGSDNSEFSGQVRACESANHDCQPPYSGPCIGIPVEGVISGSTVTGTYSVAPVCNGQGTFTGTIR
jgi:hypothetical protein